LFADVITSVGVIAGLGVVAVTGWYRLDPLIGLVVAGHIVLTGIDLVRQSFHGLMDRALAPDEIKVLTEAIDAELNGEMTYHQLRTRRVGPRRIADVHILVPGELSVREGHHLATVVERAVREALPGAELTVHVEPVEGDRGMEHWPEHAIAAQRAGVDDTGTGEPGHDDRASVADERERRAPDASL
jgi:cation diffusion facilitator family transporter